MSKTFRPVLPLLPVVGVMIILILFYFSAACEPTPEIPAVTTSPLTTTTTNQATTTSTSSTFITRLLPSGGDDTDALVAAVQSGNVLVDGPLLINKPAVISGVSDRTITFSSRGSLRRTVRPERVTWQVLVLSDVRSVTITDLEIVGPNIEVCGYLWTPPPGQGNPQWIQAGYYAAYESQHGIEIRGGSDISLVRPSVYGMSGDGLYLTPSAVGNPNRVLVVDLVTECTGRSSISNVGSDNVTITRPKLNNSGLWILNIEPFNTYAVSNYRVEDPQIGFSNFTWLFSAGPDFSCRVTNVVVWRPVFGDISPFPIVIKPCIAGKISIIY